DPLDLARDQAVGDVVEAGAAVLGGDRRAEQAHLAHLAEDRRIGGLVAEGLLHARQQLVLRIGLGGVADHALVFGELQVEQQRIVPFECVLHVSLLCGYSMRRVPRRRPQPLWARIMLRAMTSCWIWVVPSKRRNRRTSR